ncbi:MAG: DUF2029 domain-containing protein [Promethearchaeota archaeon]|nr:MAG: DUF2029 domain-containing protein [Candidatus Lokiarchaeota archaeon]
MSNDEQEYPFHLIFIISLIIITIILTIIRIFLYFNDSNYFIYSRRDYDFIILREGIHNGLINFYDPIEGSAWPPYYLYFWYFMFYPIYLLPIEIGLYLWDILRLISVVYVFFKAKELFENRTDLIIFYILSCIGYSVDAYFNNVNFLILFFLFNSYLALKMDKKWVAGILFNLATFKINAFVFLPVLLIGKKIKFKDLIYYLVPFFIVFIPYIIFPNYFMQMVTNWGHSDEAVEGILRFESMFWKALQPSHLMFIGLLLIIFLDGITDFKRKKIYRISSLSAIVIYYVYITIVVFVIPVLILGIVT